MDGSTPFNSSRVLRAADVIPPFENNDASGGGPMSRDPIPTFDLAESILAEQRRLATGKRRRSNRCREERTAPAQAEPGVAVALQERASVDLAELHRIVAGIVSRDIERLCTGPAVPV
jgi:hypothetical protein